MNDATRQNVDDAYIARHARATELLGTLQRIVEDMPAPGGETRINWGDVGSLGYLCEELEYLREHLEPTEE
ncbi:hypothetical protein FYK55_17050 [Roseiconus nitratireducens]|uniref:Uncharacterized protein n=1 Tax=Roseiconus nitratireducens TaxID=2605748 RepID=A0A5M6D350_9BACT|nr:hypothetical protein [Roseiconus nitratireducens]KAA5541904.1 hypothetical protein FYK55_17050 [Roseiconus nitratireducens]